MTSINYIRWLGHAAFEIKLAGKTLLIDPWLKDNPMAAEQPEAYTQVDAILVTHMHGDHFGDAAEIAKKTGATVIGVYEVALEAEKKGAKSIGMNIGGTLTLGEIKIIMTPALHTSQKGAPAGYIIRHRNLGIYHAGDTGLFGDIALYAKLYPIDYALIPIGGHYTMDPEQAALFVSLFNPKYAIPMHYNTFPPIRQNPENFAQQLKKHAPNTKPIILKPGEKTEIKQ